MLLDRHDLDRVVPGLFVLVERWRVGREKTKKKRQDEGELIFFRKKREKRDEKKCDESFN